MDDWRIAAELALRFGDDFELETVDEVQDEIARVSRRRSPASTPSSCAGHATAWSCRSRSTPTSSCCARPRRPRRSVVGADRARQSRRRDAPVVDRHGRGRGERHRMPSTTSPDRGRRRRRLRDRARAVEAAPTAGRGRPRCTAGTRGVGVPGRHRPTRTALRLVVARTLYDAGSTASSRPRIAALARGRRAASCTRATSTASASPRATTCASRRRAWHASSSPVARRHRDRPRHRVDLVRTRRRRGAADLIDVAAPVTDLRVETDAMSGRSRCSAAIRCSTRRHRPRGRADRHRQDDRRCSRCCCSR